VLQEILKKLSNQILLRHDHSGTSSAALIVCGHFLYWVCRYLFEAKKMLISIVHPFFVVIGLNIYITGDAHYCLGRDYTNQYISEGSFILSLKHIHHSIHSALASKYDMST